MFCPYCGKKLLENALFCTNCGRRKADMPVIPYIQQPAPVVNYVQQPPVQAVPVVPMEVVVQQQKEREALRKGEMALLDRALQFFAKKQLQYDGYDDASEQVNKFARGAGNALIVWGSIITTFLLLFTVISALTGDWAPAEFFVLTAPGVVLLILGIISKVNARKKLQYYLEGYTNLSQELYNNYLEFENCPVAAEYSNPRIIYSLMHLIQTGRADTINQAIGVLNSKTNAAAVNRHITEIKKNTFQINAQTRVPVIFAPSKFFD